MKYLRLILATCFSIFLIIIIFVFVYPIFKLCKTSKQEKIIFSGTAELLVRIVSGNVSNYYKERFKIL